MTAIRDSQVFLEVAHAPTDGKVRVSQVWIEVAYVSTGAPPAAATQPFRIGGFIGQ